ncbi:MAG: GHKL domain-containing protein, partial [Gammaproteobacteria bacterium]|nr:GHKL domain-containing protein [Gammaproteobacteria bacterium]
EDHEPLFSLSYRIIWRGQTGEAGYQYVVLQDLEPYRNEVRAFRNNLWGWLIAGVIVLVGVQAAIMYWGLQPVTGLESDLKAIENGSQDYLEGEYPSEIAGVTRSLNMLLADERRQREKYRTTLADLAHSLKTPLSILKNEASRPGLDTQTARALDEQVDRMNEIVSYQLEKAVASSSLLYGASVEIIPLVERTVSALGRVYRDKSIEIQSNAEAVVFFGDERDLYELLGNLLDNACKYGRHQVRLSVTGGDRKLTIVVEDDGPGIDVSDRDRVLERGLRLDSMESGQGIGLAVVSEIVGRYGGQVKVEESVLGGARISVYLG